MEKEIFAKIIELPTHQVLIKKTAGGDEDEDGEFSLQIIMCLESCEATTIVGFSSETSRDEAFNNYDEDSAQKYVNTLLGSGL